MNLAELCLQVLPGVDVHRIRYFTALVKPLPSDPHIRLRQEIYIRALLTLPNLTVHYGHHLRSEVSMPLVTPPSGGPRFAEVIEMEEKGSDVNIATYMLVDAFRKDCDQLIVITNDSDLAEPGRIINKGVVQLIAKDNGAGADADGENVQAESDASPEVNLK